MAELAAGSTRSRMTRSGPSQHTTPRQSARLLPHSRGPWRGHMRRREFIAALGGATAWPLVVRSEDRMIRRIGILMNFASGDAIAAARLSAFMKALESLGWAEGRSIH